MRRTFIFLLLTVMLFVSGCMEGNTVRDGDVDQESLFTLTPVNLFEGKAAKFKPFLGAMSGSFKLKYEGTREVWMDLEIWENGRMTSSAGALGDLFGEGSRKEKDEIELIISIEDLPQADKNAEQLMSSIKIADVGATGTSSYGFTVARNKELLTQGLINGVPSTFELDENAYVWGFEATSTNMISMKDFSPESLAEIEWGLLFKLRFET